MNSTPLVSVVFSFRNEELVLPELIRRLQAVFEPMPLRYELIFVNDASTDRSLEILQTHRQVNPNIKIINLSRRFGVTPGVLAGFHKSRGDAVIYMDADLQDPPELIPSLIQKWQEGADIVHTTRTVRKGENPLKMWITKLSYRFINSMADITILENTGDFKLISRRAMTEVLKLEEFDPFMRGLVAWVGFRQVQVFYEREARFAGETKFSLLRSLGPYKEFLRGLTMFSSMPLYFSLFLGLLVSFLAFLYFAIIVFDTLLGKSLAGWSPVMAVLLFLGGMILFTVGILGIYVGRIYREIKRRPNYIIGSANGVESENAPAVDRFS